MADRFLELLDLGPEARDLLRDTDVSGSRTFFVRSARPVAVLISYDEYLALGETIAAVNDTATLERIGRSSEAMRVGALLLPEDLLVE
jgi:hypothetical protein